mmetsp:Transcript_46953/g.69826  ORF Transcript_46953/g.69826 Transcript_46953/m.69826 type:complete len:428 (-) Transcript_46953:56-1339(-)|eukprot:CAMPEP_0194046988 /NCGR_PEP_ID=MMETSP0009_2-20130614/23302_1 /TAXON_ID=210454 /ORGANISM="Grammatophora oceanica, Strain CCMP 410" /LENGTH=427 /DNA_ID=CAMNT_0038692483 /DNA_START=102 /DNA_END=1385 /DNA_ORIENTATION=+
MSGLEKIALAAEQLQANTSSKKGPNDAKGKDGADAEKGDTKTGDASKPEASIEEGAAAAAASKGTNGKKRPAPDGATAPPGNQLDQKPFAFKRGIIDLNTFLEMQVHLSNLPPPPTPPGPSEALDLKDADVIFGRGGTSNHHKGNIRYRILVKKYQRLYLQAKRGDKPKIAMLIVDTIRREDGRFLKKNDSTNQWHDVGNQKAREKTSQALRERAPEIRAETSGRPTKKSKSGKSWGLATIGMVDPASALGATAMQIAKETLAARQFPEFNTSKPLSLFKSVGDDATDETLQVTEKLDALKKLVTSPAKPEKPEEAKDGDKATTAKVEAKAESKEETKEETKDEDKKEADKVVKEENGKGSSDAAAAPAADSAAKPPTVVTEESGKAKGEASATESPTEATKEEPKVKAEAAAAETPSPAKTEATAV